MEFLKAYFNDWRSASREVRLYFLFLVLSGAGIGMFRVLFNLYLEDSGYSSAVAAQVVTFTALGSALIMIPGGFLGDRGSRRLVLMAGALVAGLGQVLMSWAGSLTLILTFALISGGFQSLTFVNQIPFLAENTAQDRRINIFSLNFALILLAQVVGDVSGGALADLLALFGFSTLAADRVVLTISGLLLVAGCLPLALIRPQAPRQRVRPGIALDRSISRARRRVLILFAVDAFIVGLGAGLFVPYMNLYFSNRFGASKSLVGLVLSLGEAATALAILLGPVVTARMGRVKGVVLLQVMSLPFAVGLGWVSTLGTAVAAYLFRQALMNAAHPMASAVVMDEVPADARGLTNSLNETAFMASWALCGPVSGFLLTNYGYGAIFYLAAFFYAVSAAYYYLVFGRLDRGERLLPGTESVESAV